MNKTLVLIITATVLLMAGLVVMTITSNSLGNFGKETNTTEEQCAFEFRRAAAQGGDTSELSSKCKSILQNNNQQAEKFVSQSVIDKIT